MLGAGVGGVAQRGVVARGGGSVERPFFAGRRLHVGRGNPGIFRRRLGQQPALSVCVCTMSMFCVLACPSIFFFFLSYYS